MGRQYKSGRIDVYNTNLHLYEKLHQPDYTGLEANLFLDVVLTAWEDFGIPVTGLGEAVGVVKFQACH